MSAIEQAAVARFMGARDALSNETERAQLGLLGVSALIHLAPEEALAILADKPPVMQVMVLEMAASEGRPPVDDRVRAAVDDALRGYPRAWDSKEVALGLWAGVAEAERKTGEIDPLLRWEPVALAVEWGALPWAEAEERGGRWLNHPGLEDRVRVAMIRQRALVRERASLAEATALVERIEERVMRLSALFELALFEPEPGDLGPRWSEIALAAAAEDVTYLETWELFGRVAGVLARAGHSEARSLADQALAAFDSRPAKERGFYYTTLVRPAAAMGASYLRAVVERLDRERGMAEAARVQAAIEAAHALRHVYPEEGCQLVFEPLSELGRKAFEGAEGLKGFAYLVRAALRTGTRPADTWLAAMKDRLRRPDSPPAQPMSIARAVRTVAEVNDDIAAELEAAAPAGLTRGLCALGRLQAALVPRG